MKKKIWVLSNHYEKKIIESEKGVFDELTNLNCSFTNITEYEEITSYSTESYFKQLDRSKKLDSLKGGLSENEMKSIQFVEQAIKILKDKTIIEKLNRIKYDLKKIKNFTYSNKANLLYSKIDVEWYKEILKIHNFQDPKVSRPYRWTDYKGYYIEITEESKKLCEIEFNKAKQELS